MKRKKNREIEKNVRRAQSSIQRSINNCKLMKGFVPQLRFGSPLMLTNRKYRGVMQCVKQNPRATYVHKEKVFHIKFKFSKGTLQTT